MGLDVDDRLVVALALFEVVEWEDLFPFPERARKQIMQLHSAMHLSSIMHTFFLYWRYLVMIESLVRSSLTNV